MKVLIVADGQYFVDSNGLVFVESVFDYSFYSRYLSVFDEVYAIVRAKRVDVLPKSAKLASGKGVHFLLLPPSKGLSQYIKNYLIYKKKTREYIRSFDCAIFRLTGVVPNMVCKEYIKTKKPFAVEVVVDPWEYFAKGTMKGISRPFVRVVWTQFLKKACKLANGVSYVTEFYLQSKYPYKNDSNHFTEHYSSVELPDNSFSTPAFEEDASPFKIIHVANSFDGYGKGHITLLDALRKVIDDGYDAIVTFIGDGPLLEEFIGYAKRNKLERNVVFLGRLSNGSEVRKVMRQSNALVFPTKAEGLPRVVLEAMAEGLPVLSSPVCGIPEIVPMEYLIDYNDSAKYAQKIEFLINNKEIRKEIGLRNFQVAQNYRSSLLNEKRKAFFSNLRLKVESQHGK